MKLWHEGGNDEEIFTFYVTSIYVALVFNLLQFVLNKNMLPLQKIVLPWVSSESGA